VKTDNSKTKAGDLVQLVGLTHKNFIFLLAPGKQLHTHRGILNHDDLMGIPWGSQVSSHLGRPFFLLQPSLADLIREIKRNTQIIYPKDIGFILVNLGIGPGQHVLEAGTGSGAMTTALAYSVGDTGHVTTYEVRPEMIKLAQENLIRIGLDHRVTFIQADIAEGFNETDIPALFMDLPHPENYITHVRKALRPGGFFGCIVPTVNQISDILPVLFREQFAYTEVCEILMRYYKTVAARIRPTDRMVAHTGYLIFARPVINLGGIEGNGEEDDPDRDIINLSNEWSQ
jgi:tRNA (adenine57-N1/adenine58-N1)-methyltransferase catalytic subunit